MIKWTHEPDCTWSGRDEAGNTYHSPANKETVTVTLKDGRTGFGWTAEEAKAAAEFEPLDPAAIQQPDLALAQRIVDFLNSLLEHDRPTIAALLANRVPCSRQLADHPTVQVAVQHGGYHVGLLGLLNGLCGTYEDQTGPIGAIFEKDEDNPQKFHFLTTFQILQPRKSSTAQG